MDAAHLGPAAPGAFAWRFPEGEHALGTFHREKLQQMAQHKAKDGVYSQARGE